MEESSVSRYFKEKFNAISLTQETKEKIVQKTNAQNEPILEMLKTQSLQNSEKTRSISPIIRKFQQAVAHSKNQNNLKQIYRLKEAERLKKELQEKLEAVNSSIGFIIENDQLDHSPNNTITNERIQRLKETRKEFMDRSEKEIKEKKKKEALQQKKQEKMKEAAMLENQKKMEQQIGQEELQRRKQKEKEKLEKLQKLKQQHVEHLKRKQEQEENMKKGIEYLKSFQQKPRLYKNLSQKFELEVQMPELERRKEQLKKRRELFKSITTDNIREHSQKTEMIFQELQLRKKQQKKEKEYELRASQANYETNIMKNLLEKEKELKEEMKNKLKEKKDLALKRIKYGELIKTTQLPTPSIKKKQELEKLQEDLITKPRQWKMQEIKQQANKSKWHSMSNLLVKQFFISEKKMVNGET